jgi:subtilisin family serine protease
MMYDFLPRADQAPVAAGAQRTPLVAVIDGGVDDDHPALAGRVSGRWSADGLGGASAHATHVAGIIAGAPSEDFSGGLAPGANILDVKALDERGAGRPSDVASAFRWAVEQDADLIVTSFGSEQDHPEIRAAVDAAIRAGATIIAATGNGIGEFYFYPAGYAGVVGVTSHDRDGGLSALANSKGADFAAPGEDIVAPALNGGYTPVRGTSIAAATAAGLIAACWDVDDLLEHTLEGASPWTGESIHFSSGEIPSLSCPRP